MFSRTLTKLISSRKKGPRVLVVGGMHGNEPVGVRWFEAFQEKLARGELTLTRGEAHFLFGNPEAFARGVRHMGFDLNRAFRPSLLEQSPPASADVARAQEIARLLEGEQYDAVVDFHSVSRGDVAMVVTRVEREDDDNVIAETAVGVPPAFPIIFAYQEGDVPGMFVDWARKHLKAEQAYAVECGNHTSQLGVGRVWAFVRWLLGERLAMVEGAWPEDASLANAQTSRKVYRVVARIDASADFRWELPEERLHSEEFVEEGEVYARREGKALCAPEPSYLMMPAVTFAPQDEAIAFLCRKVGG
ncbi:hypothetical protein D6792_03080 [Candidatus Parcubacteria bacterium]|nr:MAG: hypothetical protein D6792_03080 [Candidatus Parcubacteria bacterium]